jgi:hypothetical protein
VTAHNAVTLSLFMDLANLIVSAPVWKSVKSEDEDFNIVIAHRGPAMGLWMTVQSCEEELKNSKFNYSYIVVVNGEPTIPRNVLLMFEALQKTQKLREVVHHIPALSPPSARQLGTESAVGKYIFFFDNHCIVSRGYFDRAIDQMEALNADMIHSTTQYYMGDTKGYEYPLTLLERIFWAVETVPAPASYTDPYRIAIGGHGGWLVRRSTFEEVGGYGPIGLFEGWAGEESYFDLKMALFGKTNYLDPALIHYHFPDSERGYDRHYSADYCRNLMIAANCIGGLEWVDKVAQYFSTDFNTSRHDIPALKELAVTRSNRHAEWVRQHRIRSLEEQLEYFKEHNVAH